MAAIKGLVLLLLVISVDYVAAQANPCSGVSNPPTVNTLPTFRTRPWARPPVRRCPFGWSQFGVQCFKFFSQAVNWARAEKQCQNMGGNLASVPNIVLNNFLLRLVPANTRAWVGGHDGEVDGQWLWSNGARFDYANWCRGEPNNHRRPEHCLEINFSSNRCWNDESCLVSMGYICARKLY